ncbi:MAG TPA: hypothetical protein VNB22_23645 [Pyrinomonadaceae bacterium]|jgi:hypothetical protein|nr:hypothetical protein [Pyrinomonadaceae bacterium]
MELEKINDSSDSRETLYLVGGVALIVLGAGLVMTNPTVRKTITTGLAAVLPQLQGKLGLNFSGVGSDIQRYLRLRSM